jgi:hypothetical protein
MMIALLEVHFSSAFWDSNQQVAGCDEGATCNDLK